MNGEGMGSRDITKTEGMTKKGSSDASTNTEGAPGTSTGCALHVTHWILHISELWSRVERHNSFLTLVIFHKTLQEKSSYALKKTWTLDYN